MESLNRNDTGPWKRWIPEVPRSRESTAAVAREPARRPSSSLRIGGLTLPGMIDDPAHSLESQLAQPQRGRKPASEISLEIFISEPPKFPKRPAQTHFIVPKARRIVRMRTEGKSRKFGNLRSGSQGKFRMLFNPVPPPSADSRS